MDIRPPKNWRPPQPIQPPVQNIPPVEPAPRIQPLEPTLVVVPDPVILTQLPQIDIEPKKLSLKSQPKFRVIILSIVGALLVALGASVAWYFYALQPRDTAASLQTVTIEQGMTPRTIAQLLEEKQIIRSQIAFEIYTKLNGSADSLQAGSYKLSASQSVGDIVDHLRKGINDVYNVTIIPGLTLKQLADPNVKHSLAAQGFSSSEIASAFEASYSSPVLADRPAGASLEGYLFPETYQMRVGDSLKSLIQRSLDEFYKQLQAGGLIQKFAAHNLNIHQAITLASIVQKEVSSAADQPQVAQVFLKRLSDGMMLGSDVTFIYAANQAGVTPSVDIDSPYNTRKYSGLPPGPIANMNLSALQAVANPAAGDYLFFVAGDDGVTYFSRTNEEHDAAVAAHCKVLCSQY